MQKRPLMLFAAVAVLVAVPAAAHAQGFVEAEMNLGYFYGEFGPGPNLLLFVGGTAEDFCRDNPDDPFNAEPGTGTFRIFERKSGVTDIMANEKGQPIYLYNYDGEVPDLLIDTCAAVFDDDPSTEPTAPFASGSGDLKVRLGIHSDGSVEVFNSVNGEVSSTDGTRWKVSASADLVVVDGVPVGNPADFVSLEVHPIGN